MITLTYIIGVIGIFSGIGYTVLDMYTGGLIILVSWGLLGIGRILERAKRASDLLEWMAKKNN